MAKKNSLKNALITSALSLVLCSSALVGTTYAWFTDSVTSNTNVIQTGTLKVDLELLENGSWTSIKESKKAIFDNNNWEPGYVEVKMLKIENEGSLALKYKLAIVPNGEVSALADVIDVYILDGQQEVTRDMLAGLTPVGTLRDLINDPSGVNSGSLVKESDKVITIALKMSEEAGDEYQGMSIGTFSVQLLATQYTYEEDSIDEKYDDITLVSDAVALADAIANGENVMLTNDVALDVNGKAMTVAAGADVLIDLNGNDIIGTTTASGASQVLFEVKGELTVVGDGTIALHDKSGAGFNQGYENAAIYVNGGVANLDEGMIVCTSSGEAMAYAADAVGGNSVINVNGATLYSSYIGIRSFPVASGKTNTINYNSGVVYGAKNGYDIWTQEGSGTSVVNIADGIVYTREDQWGGMYYINDDAAYVSTATQLQAALENGGYVILANDVALTEGVTVAADANVVLDLNGKTLSYTNNVAEGSSAIENKGTLTITNGTVTYKGVGDTAASPTYATNTITNSGDLTIDGATIINTTEVGASYAIDNSWGNSKLTVNSGKIESEKIAIRVLPGCDVTINGGEITSQNGYAVIIQKLSNGVVNLTINGGTFTSYRSDFKMAIYSSANGGTHAGTTIEITGGTFNGDVGFGGGDKTTKETVTITGGTFNGEVGRYTNTAEGWEDIAH